MHPLHDCCPYSKPSHFCIAHQTFTRWFPQNAQQLTAPNSNPSFLSVPHPTPPPKVIPFSKPGTKTHPTIWSPQDSQHRTRPYDKHTGSILPTATSTAPFPSGWEYRQFPAMRNGQEPLSLPGSLTLLPGQTPRAAASPGAPPPPLKPDEQVEARHYL